MDTAPTGHTLLLLDATGAYHREIARHESSAGLHSVTPMMQLQDPETDQSAAGNAGGNDTRTGSRKSTV